MLIDGIYVIINGKYIGPPKPGPWANLFYKFNIDVFKLGPLFMLFGILWLLAQQAFSQTSIGFTCSPLHFLF